MGAALVRQPWDIVISDYRMPHFSGLAALEQLKARGVDLPFILVSGTVGEDLAVAALKAGANDYLMKDKLARLVPAVERELREAVARHARQQAEEQVREQATLLDKANDAIYVRRLDGVISYWNEGAERLYGWTRAEAVGRKVADLNLQEIAATADLNSLLLKEGGWSGERRQATRTGQVVMVFARLTLMRDAAGEPASVFAIDTDITEKKQLEARFLQAQRLENLGVLASGIAHDLNNVLTPILMASAILLEKAQTGTERDLLATMMASARRGAGIVHQVLTFARGVEGVRIPLQPQHLLREMQSIMRETFPKNI
jgi:PAS domain S-box-containing protein